MKVATKSYNITRLTLGMLLHYLGKLKIHFCLFSAHMEECANKLRFKCTDCNSSTRITVYMLSVLKCFCPNLVLVAEYHVHC